MPVDSVGDKKHGWMSLPELEAYIKAHPEFRNNDHKKWKGAKWKDKEWIKKREDESTADFQMRLFGHLMGGPLPDRRDTPKLARSLPAPPIKNLKLASSVDLRQWCTGIEDQDGSPYCSAYSCVAAFEWLQNNKTGSFINGSERFVVSNRQQPPMGRDTDLYVTETWGVAPKSIWDWTGGNPSVSWETDATVATPGSVNAEAAKYKTTNAWMVGMGSDTTTAETTATLTSIKTTISNYNTPVVLAFLIYPNTMSGPNGVMLLPTGPWMGGDSYGAHSMLCVGYSDSAGYLIFQNSWGTGYGDNGFYYMPYEFVIDVSTDNMGELLSNVGATYIIYEESEISTTPPIQIPSGSKTFPSMSEIDITNYLTLKHDGQPTPGQHSVEIVPVDGSAHVNAHVRVREKQPRKE